MSELEKIIVNNMLNKLVETNKNRNESIKKIAIPNSICKS